MKSIMGKTEISPNNSKTLFANLALLESYPLCVIEYGTISYNTETSSLTENNMRWEVIM